MTAPAHYAIGAASAMFIQNFLPAQTGNKTRVAFAWLIAIGSHLGADAIPHAEHFFKGWHLALELVIETIIMMGVLVGASQTPLVAMIILAGMAGAAIPDGLGMLNQVVYLRAFSWLDIKMHYYHYHGKLPLIYANLWVQIAITVLCSCYVRTRSASNPA